MKQIHNVSKFCSELKDFERESECNFLASNCVGLSWYLYLGEVFIYLHTHIDGGYLSKNPFFTFLIWIGASPPSPTLIPAIGEASLLIANLVLSSSVNTHEVFMPISLHFWNRDECDF